MVFFRVGIQNTGLGDELLSPTVWMSVADLKIRLRPTGEGQSYTLLAGGKVVNIWLVVEEDDTAIGDLNDWKSLVNNETPAEFDLQFSGEDAIYVGHGTLPIREFIYTQGEPG